MTIKKPTQIALAIIGILSFSCSCGFAQNKDMDPNGDPLFESVKNVKSIETKQAVAKFKVAEDGLDRAYLKAIKDIEKEYALKFELLRAGLESKLKDAKVRAAAKDFEDAKYIEKLTAIVKYRNFAPISNRSLMDSRHGEKFYWPSGPHIFGAAAEWEIRGNKIIRKSDKKGYTLNEIGNGHLGFLNHSGRNYVFLFTNNGHLLCFNLSANKEGILIWEHEGTGTPVR